MDKSSRLDIPLDEQREMWNHWNAAVREGSQNRVSRRQARIVKGWLQDIGRQDLQIMDVGCGSGWLTQGMLRFGNVTGTDLADDVLLRAQERIPEARFIAGDFMRIPLEPMSFDVAVTLEVLSHVRDQPAFLSRIADILRPDGLLMLATQNRPVLERWSAIGPPQGGQIRRWVDAQTLRRLVGTRFEILRLVSICPVGDQGFLRIVNSVKLNRVLEAFLGGGLIERAKERAMLGHTLMVLARRRTDVPSHR